MKIRLPRARYKILTARVLVALATFSILSFSTALNAFAQRSFSKTYPARSNVRLELRNWSGAIKVETWERSEIKISADMESPAARFPGDERYGLKIDVVNAIEAMRHRISQLECTSPSTRPSIWKPSAATSTCKACRVRWCGLTSRSKATFN